MSPERKESSKTAGVPPVTGGARLPRDQASGGRRRAGTTENAKPKSQSEAPSAARRLGARAGWGAAPWLTGGRDGLRRDGRRLGGSAFLVIGCVSYSSSVPPAIGTSSDAPT